MQRSLSVDARAREEERAKEEIKRRAANFSAIITATSAAIARLQVQQLQLQQQRTSEVAEHAQKIKDQAESHGVVVQSLLDQQEQLGLMLQQQQQPQQIVQPQKQQQQQRGATPDASPSALRSADIQLPAVAPVSTQLLLPSSLGQSSLQPVVGGAATPPLRRPVDSVAPLQKRQQQQQTRPLTPDFSSPVVSAASHSLSVRFSDDVAQVILMTSNTHT